MTHDYKRNGTTTLFAAMSTLDGLVISRCAQRHRNVEWLDFLRQIDRETPKAKELHLACDNYATHKPPNVKEWLEKHPRFHIHFTPPSASWLNMVERFFRRISTDRLERGVFRSVPELVAAIEDYIAIKNSSFGPPKPMSFSRKSFAQIAALVPRKTTHTTLVSQSGLLAEKFHPERLSVFFVA